MKNLLGKIFQGDRTIWVITIFLMAISILVIYSSVDGLAEQQNKDAVDLLQSHILKLIIGAVTIYLIHLVPYNHFWKFTRGLLYLSIIFLLYVLFTPSNNSASRWIEIPIVHFQFQPSELAKFALIMYISRILAKHQKNADDLFNSFYDWLIPLFLITGLIVTQDLSTAVLLFGTILCLLIIARVAYKQIGRAVGYALVGLLLIIVIGSRMPNSRVGTWANRAIAFVTPSDENPDADYQSDRAKTAVATSSLWGKGPGNSTQRDLLPQAYSDFIYAIVIEEYGIGFATLILILYLVLTYRTGIINKKTPNTYAAFLAVGLMLNLLFQAFINMGVSVGIFPVTGQPLPLISWGGSNILFTSISLGIILSISRSVDEPEDIKKNEEIILTPEPVIEEPDVDIF